MSTPSTASVFSSSEEEYFTDESRSSSSSDDDDSENSNDNNDALQVRQKAFDLLQKIGPDRNEAQEEWPMSPRLSYQHSGGGGARGSPPRRSASRNSNASSRSNSRPQQALPFPADYFPQSDMDDDLDEPLPARLVTPRNSNTNHCTNNSENGNSWFPDSLVQCFSHACRVGANEIMAQHRQGYESIKEGAVILWNTDADQEARELLSGGRED